jgi:predicted dehydrogenase
MNTAAIIGCGRTGQPQGGKVGWGIAHSHAAGYRQAFLGIDLLAVDPNPENLKAFGDKYGIPESRRFDSTAALYAAVIPHAASVCTWPALHVPQAIEAARRGVKAITVEKPLGLHGFEIQELIDVAAATKASVAVAHQRRYEPWFIEARELIRRGELGDRLVIEARVGDDWDVLSWTVHWFDMANFLFDATPQWVLAGVEHTGERRYGHAVENASTIFVQYPDQRQASFITGPTAQPHFGVTVRGNRGMLVIDATLKLWTTVGYREITPPATSEHSAFATLFADLWSTVGTDRVSVCDIAHCATATLMAYAAHESARTMKRVSLPLTTWYAPLEVAEHVPTREATATRRVALLADGHHEWRSVAMSGRDGLRDALEALGHTVTLHDAARDLADDALADADVLVLYHTQRKATASHRAVVGRWFESGRPVVVSHCGIGAYADWPEFRRWIGRYWVWGEDASLPPSRHPHVSCTLRVEADAGFAVPWREAWLPVDELYLGLGEASPVRVLVTATSPDGAEQDYAWQVREHPNVVAWLPGHRRDMFALAAVRDGLNAALQLACVKSTAAR